MYLRTPLLPLLLSATLLLTGCGTVQREAQSGSAVPASSAAPAIPTDADKPVDDSVLQFQLAGEPHTLAPNETYDCSEKQTERMDYKTSKTLDTYQGTITTARGITLGSTIDDVVKQYDLQPGYANLNYEYDPYGDGCTEINEEIYDGTMVELAKKHVLDLRIIFGYYQNHDQWYPVNFQTADFTAYDTCVIYSIDCEPGHNTADSASVQAGSVFSITVSYLDHVKEG